MDIETIQKYLCPYCELQCKNCMRLQLIIKKNVSSYSCINYKRKPQEIPKRNLMTYQNAGGEVYYIYYDYN